MRVVHEDLMVQVFLELFATEKLILNLSLISRCSDETSSYVERIGKDRSQLVDDDHRCGKRLMEARKVIFGQIEAQFEGFITDFQAC